MTRCKLVSVLLILLMATAVVSQQTTLQEEQDYRFAIQLANKGLHDVAALQFERLAETYPLSPRAPEALLYAGENYEQADSLHKAAQAYMSILFKYPQSDVVDRAQFAHATLLSHNDEPMKAAIAFDRLKILNPNSPLIPEAQIHAAEQFLAAEEYQRAFDAAFYLLEQDRSHPLRLQAQFLIAQAHEARGDYSQAVQNLDRILADRVEDDFAARTYTFKAELLRKLGRYTQADSVLHKLVDGNYASPVIAAAAVDLSQSLQSQRNYTASNDVVEKALSKVAPQDQAELRLVQADNRYLLKEFLKAKTAYTQIDFEQLPHEAAYFYRLGLVNIQLNDTRNALGQFEVVLEDSSISEAFRHYASLEYARLLAEENRVLGAIQFLQESLEHTRVSAFRNQIFFEIARLQETKLNDYAGARQNYAAVMASAPKSTIVDEAQYHIARAFEQEGDVRNAAGEYRRYLTYYPGGDLYGECRQRVHYLDLMTPKSPNSNESNWSELMLQSMAASSNVETLYKLARYEMHNFRNYDKALDYLQQAYRNDMDERLDKDQLSYDMAFCHYVSHIQALQQNNYSKAQTHADALNEVASQMGSFSSPDMIAQVKYWNIETQLQGMSSTENRAQFLESSIRSFPSGVNNDSLKHVLHIQLVNNLMASDTSDSNYQKAGEWLNEVLQEQPKEELLAEALYKQALLLHRQANSDSAIQLLNRLYNLRDVARRVDGIYLLATIYEENENYIDAQRLYADIVDHYFYSNWAERAQVKLISLMIQQGQHRAAHQRMQQRERTQIPQEIALFYQQQTDDEALWLWAQLNRHTSSPHEAIQNYQAYLDLGRNTPHRAEALFAVAELANEMNQQDMALGYFEELAQAFSQDSLGEVAQLAAADLYFDRGNYEAARDRYAAIRKTLTGDLQKQAFQYQIICEYRLGRQRQAANLEKQFKDEHDDRNAEARFLYEEGMYYLSRKDFNRAEKSFKQLGNRYDDVPEGARGDLGLARLYVIQTKTEDALKRLTEIPEKYDDPEIVATAYVNLADFYYKNRQIENAILAGTEVLDYVEIGPLRAQALDILIDAYDDLNMRDKAIALQREYIELYPHDPDILDRKIRIGVFLYGLKEYDRAISHLKQLRPLVSADNEAEVQYWIAKSYSDAGITEQAIIEFLKVRYQCKQTKLPWGATALYEAGNGYRKLGNLDKAKEMFQLVVQERGATDNIGRAANAKIDEINAEIEARS